MQGLMTQLEHSLHRVAGRYLKASDGSLAIGTGAVVAALEYCGDVTATVVGKPSKGYFEAALGIL